MCIYIFWCVLWLRYREKASKEGMCRDLKMQPQHHRGLAMHPQKEGPKSSEAYNFDHNRDRKEQRGN